VDEPEHTDRYWTPEEVRDWEPKAVDEADRLYDVAHARAGDKGDVSNIVLVPFEDEAFEDLVEVVTVERVRDHFDGLVEGEIERYPVPGTNCINLVLRGALDGGVASSLRLDRYGKSLSRHLLAMPLEAADGDGD
jgi:hypothetical protein